MQLFGAYLRGFLPFIVIEIFSNFDFYNLKFVFSFDIWNIYLVVSFLILFPLVFMFRNRMQMSQEFSKALNDSLEKKNKEPMRLGSLYANSKMFGVSRIGDSGSENGGFSKVGIAFVYYLLVLLFSPVFLLFYIIKK